MILSKVIQSRDMAGLAEAQITTRFFVDEEHLQTLAWMTRHYTEHGSSPSEQALKANFPTYKLIETPEPMSFYVERLRQAYKYDVVSHAISEAAEWIEDEDVAQAQKVLSRALSDIDTTVNPLRDHNLTDPKKFDELFDYYADLTRNPDSLRGYSTGWPTLDLATMGLQPGQLVTFVGPPKGGKAQPLDELVLTPSGWVQMGSVSVGDYVVNHNGKSVRVLATRDWENREVWRVTTDDGGSALVDREHEWTIHPHRLSKRTVPTWAIADALAAGKNRYAMLPLVEVRYPVADLPVDPYVVGALLGDGGMSGGSVLLTKSDLWMHEEVAQRLPAGCSMTWSVEGLTTRLRGMNGYARQLGMFGLRSWEKSIPPQYLQGSVKQRLDLLAGLLDTDGGMSNKTVEFSTTSEVLAGQVQQLVWSLGGCCTSMSRVTRHQNGEGRRSWRLKLRIPLGNPFRMPRKRVAWEERGSVSARPPTRRIVSAEKVSEGQRTRCLQVDNPQGLYVTRDYLVTHNSTVMLSCADAVQRLSKVDVLMVSFEMSYDEMVARWVALRAHLNYRRLLKGQMNNSDERRLEKLHERLKKGETKLVLSEDVSSTTTVSGIVAKIQLHKPKAVFIDGVYLMDDENGEPKGSSAAITNVTRSLKRVAQIFGVPIVISTQTLFSKMRGQTIQAGSIGYSSSFSQDSDAVIAIEPREDGSTHQHWIKILLSRSGPKTEVEIDFDWTTSTFTEHALAPGDIDDDPDLQDEGKVEVS